MRLNAANGVLCAFAALFPIFASAQPFIKDVKVEAISHATVAIRYQVHGISGESYNYVEYGKTHLLGFRTGRGRSTTRSIWRSIIIGGLAPDTSYYFRVVVEDADTGYSDAWYCRSGEGGPGFECDGPDAPPRFRTASLPSKGLILPAPPREVQHPFPSMDGQTFTVSVDAEQRCLDFQAQLNAAAKADPQQNHEVVIPAGATCYGEAVLPPKLGAGVVTVRPSTPLDRLPPPGIRIHPSFRPLMATLSVPRDWRRLGLLQHVALSTPVNCDGVCTEGWRLVGLEITHPEHDEVPPRTARIASISRPRPGTLTILLESDLPVEHGQSVAIAGVRGAPELNSVWLAAPAGERALEIRTNVDAEGAGGGYVTQAVSIPFESCGPGPQPVCRTAIPHGLPEPPAVPVASIENRIVRTPGTTWPVMSTVELERAEGLRGAVRVGGGLQLAGARPPDCSADCGAVRLRPSLQAFGFDAESKLEGSHIYTVLSETEVRLDAVAEATAETTGGFLTLDPNAYPQLVVFRKGSRNIVVDRCWLHGRGFPTRLQRALTFASDDSAIVGSVISEVHSWRPITHPGGSADFGAHNGFASTAIPLGLGDASGILIRNNLFENCPGITIYAEQFRATSAITPSDVIIEGNTFRTSDAYRAGSASSNGRYYGVRHLIEFKRGERILIENNVFDGNWADWTPLGPAINLSSRGEGEAVNNRIQDVAIRNNVFRRVSTGVQILSTDDRIEQPSLPVARIAIENNLFEDVDFYRMRSAPSAVALLNPSTNFGGQIMHVTGVLEDFTVRRNTAIDNRGRSPAFFWFRGGRGSGVQVTENILTHNDDFLLGGLPRAGQAGDFEGAAKGSPSDEFRRIFTQTPDPDPRSAFARNLVLPGVRNSSSPSAYDNPNRGMNFTKADCEQFYAGFDEIECAGSGAAGETANQRFGAVFPDRANLNPSNGRGAEVAILSALQKSILLPVLTLLRGAPTIDFETKTTDSCIVDVSSDETFADFRRFDDPGGPFHSISLEGLEPGVYQYRILCASDALFGEISVP